MFLGARSHDEVEERIDVAYNYSFSMFDANIGSAKDNVKSAIHNWYRFTAGFSYKFIDFVVDEMECKPHCIYEPFAGCGTTLVAAQKKRIHSIGNESQQLMCDIINAKLNWDIDSELCKKYIDYLLNEIHSNADIDISDEYNPLLCDLYDAETLKNLYLLRDYISTIGNDKYELFLKLALSQTLHKAALHPIAVPYIVRSKNLVNSGDALGKFTSIAYQMLSDLDTVPHHERMAEVHKADSRNMNPEIENGCCDLCITSPPYLNNLDYGEVSKVHSHFFKITNDWRDITEKVRHQLVTGATTHYKDADFNLEGFMENEFSKKNPKLMEALVEKFEEIRSKAKDRKGKKSFHILMMHYFEDMFHVLMEMKRVLKRGSKAYLILGDSAPYGVYIPTTEFLGEIAKSVGFRGYSITKIRDRGHKWKSLSQRHSMELSENVLVLNR